MPAHRFGAHAVGMADTPPHGMRVSDADRAKTAQALSDALAEGRLTHDEAGERLAACWSARYDHELAGLTADLPRPTPPPVVRDRTPAPSVWNGALLAHTAIASVISAMLIARWAVVPDFAHHPGFGPPAQFAGQADFFWPVFPIVWLAISVLVHYGIRVRRARRYGG